MENKSLSNIERDPIATLPDQAMADLITLMADSAQDDIRELTQLLIFQIPSPSKYLSLLCQMLIDMEIYDPNHISKDQLFSIKKHWASQAASKVIWKDANNGAKKFPALFGILKFHKKWLLKNKDDAYVSACKVFLSICQVDFSTPCNGRQYYEHTYRVRDVLIKIADKHPELLSGSIKSSRIRILQFITELKHTPLCKTINDNEKWEVIESILCDTRTFACPLRADEPECESLPTLSNDTIDSADAPSSMPFDVEETSDPYDSAESEAAYKRKTGKAGSRLTKKDDQRTLMYKYQALGARNNFAITDVHRLTLLALSRFLSELFEDEDATELDIAYAFILLSCGVPEDRLAEMVSTTEQMAFKEGLIYFRCDTEILYVSLNNGHATWPDADGGHADQFMEILLPAEVCRVIKSSKDEHPFKVIADKFDYRAQAFGQHHPGLTPTARRIKSSFHTVFAADCFKGPLEASFLSGTIPYQYAAQAHYYRFDMEKLNQKYQQGVLDLVENMIWNGQGSVEFMQYIALFRQFNQESSPSGSIGSRLDADRDEYFKFMAFIRSEFHDHNDRIDWYRGEREIQHVFLTLQLQHLNLYFLTQVATALRPPGKKTTFSANEHFDLAYSDTKPSTDFTEINVAPVHKVLKAQIMQCREDLEKLELWAKQRGLILNQTRKFHHDLALTFRLRKNSRMIVPERMTGAKVRDIVTKLTAENGLSFSLPVKANNLFRHKNATALYQDVPDILLDEYMAHGREGLDMFNPWSTTSFTCYPTLEDKIDELIKGLVGKPLKVNFHV
ncbi:hypothetical protein Ga0123462_1128 [Mariprofundus ferrinatatus]|uniref:Uncharacterized protein n=1 Tax=Mariprofundus ferrinatatus TaxID=1921087 RepID=A0A2K8L4G0_9PROT|nr:hypothetical protein [Mariprofundus ferrinatatus]ATX81992.1 hypothetical protein Ga0123462_1128 [Mariprofundus ferrinatatus]